MTNTELTDLALCAGRGDRTVLVRVIEAVQLRALVCARKVVPPDDVDDAVQEIMLRLCKSIGSFKGKSAFMTWFVHLSRNTIADFLRDRKVRSQDYDPDYLARHCPRAEAVDFESTIEFDDLLDNVPEQYRDVFRLYFAEGCKFSDMAEAHSPQYEKIHSSYRRGIKWCREHVDELGLAL